MPYYDYRVVDPDGGCEVCRPGFEVEHGMNEPGPAECPKCKAPVRRIWGAVNVTRSTAQLLNKDNLHKHGFQTGTDLLESGDVKLD